jgi:hypothetical protein
VELLGRPGGGSGRRKSSTYTEHHNTERQTTIHAVSRIRTHDLSFQAMKAFASDLEQPLHYIFWSRHFEGNLGRFIQGLCGITYNRLYFRRLVRSKRPHHLRERIGVIMGGIIETRDCFFSVDNGGVSGARADGNRQPCRSANTLYIPECLVITLPPAFQNVRTESRI